MTAYRTTHPYSPIAVAAQAAKARRLAILNRVRAQRAKSYKRTVADWMRAGYLLRGSVFKDRYLGRQ